MSDETKAVAVRGGSAVAFGLTPEERGKFAASLMQAVDGIAAYDGKDILKLDPDDGIFVFGQDRTPVNSDVEDYDLWAVNISTFRHGYVAFTDPKGGGLAETEDGNLADVSYPIRRPLPELDSLPFTVPVRLRGAKEPYTPQWQHQISVEMLCVEGPNLGVTVIYKPVSYGGLKFMRKLSEEVARQLSGDGERIVPLIELRTESYRQGGGQTGKRIFNPVFHVHDWASPDDEILIVDAPAKREDAPPARTPAKPRQEPRQAARQEAAPTRARASTGRRAAPEPEPEEFEEDDEYDTPPEPRGRAGVRPGRKADVDDTAHRGRAAPVEEHEEPEEPQPVTRRRTAARDEAIDTSDIPEASEDDFKRSRTVRMRPRPAADDADNGDVAEAPRAARSRSRAPAAAEPETAPRRTARRR